MKPFLFGRKTTETLSLRAPHLHSSPAPAGLGSAASPGPQVEVVKEGDKVVRLVVVCSCGERIEVECLYPAAG
jgi:hypothetical protein